MYDFYCLPLSLDCRLLPLVQGFLPILFIEVSPTPKPGLAVQ
jgi:hypothetical protein